MGAIHEIIKLHGRVPAKRFVAPSEVRLVNLAASVLRRDSLTAGYTISCFGQASLPHRARDAETAYVMKTQACTVVLEPGELIDAEGKPVRYGIPFGPRARLIMLFLESEAIRNNSRVINMHFTMNDWLERMHIRPGGKTYAAFREQQQRIAACRVTVAFTRDPSRNFVRQPIIDGPLELFVDKSSVHSGRRVVLNEHMFESWRENPVPLWEEAVTRLSSQSLAVDAYCWLASTLYKLNAPVKVDWSVLHRYFGSSYNLMRHFKPRFVDCLKMALAVYPEAQVEIDEKLGVLLSPSAPPIQDSKIYGSSISA